MRIFKVRMFQNLRPVSSKSYFSKYLTDQPGHKLKCVAQTGAVHFKFKSEYHRRTKKNLYCLLEV